MNYIRKVSTGEFISFYSASISTDKSNYCWNFSADIADEQSLDKLKPVQSLRGDYVEIGFKLASTQWLLIVEDVNYNDTGNGYSLTARSKTVFLDEKYNKQLTKQWNNTTAQTIVNELCVDAGITLDWQITDWLIDSYTVTNQVPISIISDLISEKKAIAQALPNSDLVVRYNLPCSPNKINEQIADHIVATDKNIFERSHKFISNKNYNRITVAKQTDSTTEDKVSFSVEEQQQGADVLLLIWCSPVVPNITLSHTSGNAVNVYYEGQHSKTITDQLTITEGKAKLTKPFVELVSVQWQQDVLGNLSINQSGDVTVDGDFGLVNVIYKSSYHQYRFQRVADIDLTAIKIDDIQNSSNTGQLNVEYVIGAGDNVAPPAVVRTLSTQPDLIDRAKQELWEGITDMEEYNLECAYDGSPIFPANIANVTINKTLQNFNAFVKSVSIQISKTITQQITIQRPLL